MICIQVIISLVDSIDVLKPLVIGVWRQGDFIVLNPHTKGLIILGRRLVIFILITFVASNLFDS